MKNPYAIGKNIYLRAPESEDIDSDWYTWFSDPETTKYLADRNLPNTKEKQQLFLEEMKNSNTRIVLIICDKENDESIGVGNLSSISWVHRKADVALVIGNKSYRNGTTAVETMTLLLKIAFQKLNLKNLLSHRLSNHDLTKAIEKIFEFKQVGCLEDINFMDGKYNDLIISQLKCENWVKRNPPK